MRRSKTSEHSQLNLATTRVAVVPEKKLPVQLKSSGGSTQALHRLSIAESRTTNPTTHSGGSLGVSDVKLNEVSKIAEERRKDRLKALTRNLEVCDLLDMRDV